MQELKVQYKIAFPAYTGLSCNSKTELTNTLRVLKKRLKEAKETYKFDSNGLLLGKADIFTPDSKFYNKHTELQK